MAKKNWQNLGFVTNFLTKFAFLTNEKWHFWWLNPLEPSDSTANISASYCRVF